MGIIGAVLLFFWLVLYLCTISYKKKLRKKIDKRKHKLWLLYGMSMFLTDKIPEKWIAKKSPTDSYLKSLTVKENIKKEKYFYLVEKISVCLLAVFLVLVIGNAVYWVENTENYKIKDLKRDQWKDLSYTLTAMSEDGEKETIQIKVAKKKQSKEDIQKLLKEKEQKLIETVLGNNSSPNHVQYPLNLVTSIGEENILVEWEIDDKETLHYDGTISENVPEQGKLVTLTATLIMEEVSENVTFCVNIYPNKKNGILQKKIQDYIDQGDENQNRVALPQKIGEKNISYYTEISHNAGYVFIFGMADVVCLFFLKDRELKTQVKERKEQLQDDYPEIVSKILLYYGAGLSVSSALENILQTYHQEKEEGGERRYAYEEMEMALTKIKSGVSEITALIEYGNRCGTHSYIKMVNIIIQNLRRGTREMTTVLKSEASGSILDKKHRKLKEGGEISTKLLGPMILMLIISIGIIIVPAFLSIPL